MVKDEETRLLANNYNKHNSTDENHKQLQEEEDLLMIQNRKFDLTELCHIFLGPRGQKIYSAYVCLDIYSYLWVYASVFANAMSTAFQTTTDEDEQDLYPWFIGLFAIIVIPMSVLELSEQTFFQVFLSGCRILMVCFLIGTPIVAAAFTTANDDSTTIIPHFNNQIHPSGINNETTTTTWFNLSNLHQMIPIAVYSVIFHQAIPGLAHTTQHKSKIGIIFSYTFFFLGFTYALIGWIDAWYFGNGIYESCNLNWKGYHGGTGRFVLQEGDEERAASGYWVDVAAWAQFISFFVVVFPALDVLSAFPINAFILGNSMRDMMIMMTRNNKNDTRTTNQEANNCNHTDNNGNNNYNNDDDNTTLHSGDNEQPQLVVVPNKQMTIFYRAMAAIPPIIGAFFVRDLGIVTDYSGLTGLAIAFCFPPLLYIASDYKMKQHPSFCTRRTVYERFGSSSVVHAKIMLLFGLILIVYCFCLLTFGS